jgi:hypothetical protein
MLAVIPTSLLDVIGAAVLLLVGALLFWRFDWPR